MDKVEFTTKEEFDAWVVDSEVRKKIRWAFSLPDGFPATLWWELEDGLYLEHYWEESPLPTMIEFLQWINDQYNIVLIQVNHHGEDSVDAAKQLPQLFKEWKQQCAK